MLNNAERFVPFAEGPAAAAILAARAARTLTGLDEGQAWRRLKPSSLAVLRVEVYARPDEVGHRAAWTTDAEACLDATWRDRWAERDHPGGWIEARWVDAAERNASIGAAPTVDWLRVEDHTDPTGGGGVALYEYLTVWGERTQATLTIRHPLDDDLDGAVAGPIAELVSRIDG